MSVPEVSYESTIKFNKEEEVLDRFIYRPIGYRLALFFNRLKFTPNQVTYVSIIVGLAGAVMYYPESVCVNLGGVLLFILANMLDCADGQLARMTHASSRVGRVLDGFAGDLWFTTMYFMLAFRSIFIHDIGWWVFLPILLSGFSHARQAGMADFFKNVHLQFLKGPKGGEVDDLEDIYREYNSYSWTKNLMSKVLLFFYIDYTKNQDEKSPAFFEYKRIIEQKFDGKPPKYLIDEWCKKNRNLLYYVHALSFNGRTPALFLFVLTGYYWVYFVFEIVVLNVIMFFMIKAYSRSLKELNSKLLSVAK